MDKSPEQPPSIPDAAREAASDVVDAVNDNMALAIRRNPLQSVAIAAGVGFILALVLR